MSVLVEKTFTLQINSTQFPNTLSMDGKSVAFIAGITTQDGVKPYSGFVGVFTLYSAQNGIPLYTLNPSPGATGGAGGSSMTVNLVPVNGHGVNSGFTFNIISGNFPLGTYAGSWSVVGSGTLQQVTLS